MTSIHKQSEIGLIQNSSCFSKDNLEKLKQAMVFLTFQRNVNIFCEGDDSNTLYFVQSGLVKLSKFSEEGNTFSISLFHTGDFFDDFDPFLDTKHGYTAKTSDTCVIGAISRGDLELLLWQHGELNIEFMKWMGYMHRLTQTKFRDLMMLDKLGALCSTLIRLANSYGVVDDDGIHLTLKLSNYELADYIGCVRESVNRMISQLKKAGAVAIKDGIISIIDLPYLQSVCKCEGCPIELCRL